MRFFLLVSFGNLAPGTVLEESPDLAPSASISPMVYRDKTYFVPPQHLLPLDVPVPWDVRWADGAYVVVPRPDPVAWSPPPTPPPVTPDSLGPRASGSQATRRVETHLGLRGRTLRLFCAPLMDQADLHRFILASEDFMMTTGDQSLGEGLAAMKRFHYECEPHKRFLMEDLGRVDLGLASRSGPPDPAENLLEDMLAYFGVMQASGQLQEAEIPSANRFLMHCCYPAEVPESALIIVTCKDAGGQGDIVNATKTRALLAQAGCKNVHLAMARTARDKALALNKDESVWLVDESPTSELSFHIRKFPEELKSKATIVLHVAAQLTTPLETVIKTCCTLGHFSNARTIFLPEYGYTCGSKYSPKREPSAFTMGPGVGELGIHVLEAFFAHGRAGYVDATARGAARLTEMTGSVGTNIAAAVLGRGSSGDYGANHRLYAGYSHGHGVRFLKLVAHLERWCPHVDFVDVVIGGNEKRAKTPRALYEDLKAELGAGGGPDLDRLGFTSVELHIFDPPDPSAPSASSSSSSAPPPPGVCTVYRIDNAEPSAGAEPAEIALSAFFDAMNPAAESALDRGLYERMGRWLSTDASRRRFQQMGAYVCVQRDFRRLFGPYMARLTRCVFEVSDQILVYNELDAEELAGDLKLRGNEILTLEKEILKSEALATKPLRALAALAVPKFSTRAASASSSSSSPAVSAACARCQEPTPRTQRCASPKECKGMVPVCDACAGAPIICPRAHA